MGKWSDQILGGEKPLMQGEDESTSVGRSWSSEILTSQIKSDTPRLTSAIPEERLSAEQAPRKGLNLGALGEAAYVDDPQTKFRILAKRRFPNLPIEQAIRRYGTDDDGRIYYVDEKGYRQPEEAEGLLGKAGQFIAELPAKAPAIVGGALGEIGFGPKGAAIGSALGEGMRKVTGALWYGEPVDPLGIALDVGTEGAFGGLSSLAGKGISALTDARKAAKQGIVGKIARRDFPRINQQQLDELGTLSRRSGIPLTVAEKSGLPSLLERQRITAQIPETADRVGEFYELRADKINKSLRKFFEDTSPEPTPFRAGEKVSTQTRAAINKMKEVRKELTAPLYEEAFQSNVDVDVKPILDFINTELETAKGQIRTSLSRAKGMLTKGIKKGPSLDVVDDVTRKIIGAKSGDIKSFAQPKFGPSQPVLETSLRATHQAKLALDEMLERTPQNSLGRTSQAKIAQVKDMLVKQMETASPKYGEARRAFAAASPAIEEAGEGITGQLAKLEGDSVAKADRLVFGSSSSPEAVARAKTLIAKDAPEAWDALTRAHLQRTLDEVAESATGDVLNIGGQYRKKLFGTQAKRDMLRAALTPQRYKALEDLMKVLEASGRAMNFGSPTATRQLSMEEFKREGASTGAAVVKTLNLLEQPSRFGAWWNNLSSNKYASQFVDAIMSEEGMQAIKKLRQLKPGSKQAIQTLATITGVTLGDEALQGLPFFGPGAQESAIETEVRQGK